MAEIPNRAIYSQTDSSNTGALPGLSGSSSPALIDDAIRADMGATAREYDWRTYAGTVGGSANAYTLTYTVAPAAYYNPMRFTFVANFAVTGSATLNVNSLGAKTIKKLVAGVKTNLASGDISSGDYVEVVYDGTDFVWVNRGAASSAYTVNAQTAETAVDTADFVGGYDTSGTAERKFSVNNLHKAVNTFTAETAVAVDDVVGLYDTSASTMDKATVQNVFKAINGLTEDTSPETSADFVMTYDNSASDVKKVKLSTILGGTWAVVETLTPSSVATSATTVSLTGYKAIRFTLIGLTPATNNTQAKLEISSDGTSYSAFNANQGSYNSFGGVADTSGFLCTNQVSNTASNGGVNGHGTIYNTNVGERALTNGMVSFAPTGAASGGSLFTGSSNTITISHIRFSFSSGNIASGTIIIEGLA